MAKKKKDIFNPAFEELDQKLHALAQTPEKDKTRGLKQREREAGDDMLFLDAVSDVKPLPHKKMRTSKTRGAHMRPKHPAPDDEQYAMTHLHGLVKGDIEMDITFSDEYMEGAVKGFNRKHMKRLKRGQYPVRDYIDLHGLTKYEAEIRVRDFLIESHKLGHRCVLIVHGRGLNSPDSLPILKESLPVWFRKGPIKKIVVAFATARPYDGGTGAVYVLLRK